MLNLPVPSKQTTKLFNRKFKYKIALKCGAAFLLRGCTADIDRTRSRIIAYANSKYKTQWVTFLQNSPEVLSYMIDLLDHFQHMDEYAVRIQNPIITVYTNNEDDIVTLANISINNVKYVCEPSPRSEHLLLPDVQLVKRLEYDYKLTVRHATNETFNSFVKWASGNKNVKIPKSLDELTWRQHNSGIAVYIKNNNALLIAKMMLGNMIVRTEQIVKT